MSKEKSVMYPSVTWMECEDLIKKIDKYNGKVAQYNDLISPGSTYLLYGTENIGVNISLHYYF